MPEPNGGSGNGWSKVVVTILVVGFLGIAGLLAQWMNAQGNQQTQDVEHLREVMSEKIRFLQEQRDRDRVDHENLRTIVESVRADLIDTAKKREPNP